MGVNEVRAEQGMLTRVKNRAAVLSRRRWILELLGLLALSAFIQLAGPFMWSPSVVEKVVDGFSSVHLVAAMLVLMFVVLGVWITASIFDLDRPLLPVFKWIFVAGRTYTLSIVAIVVVAVLRGAAHPHDWGRLVLAIVIGIICGVMLEVFDQRKRQIDQGVSDSVSAFTAILANCVLTILAVASFWGFINFQKIVAELG